MNKISIISLSDPAKNNKVPQIFRILADRAYRLALRLTKYLRREYNKLFNPFLILRTPMMSCASHGRPEVHSLVSHRHVYSYILAIKSFLRFYNDVSVIVHDDGSLTKKDKHTIKKHIENIKIINRNYADEKVNRMLAHHPNCRRYRDEYVNALQLFDFMLLCESSKIVSLDSDILFFKKPDTLTDWLHDGAKIIHFWEQDPLGTREFLAKTQLGDCFVPICICLVCFFKETMNLDLLEQILSDIRKFDWWTGQSLYPVLLKKQIEKHELSFFEPSQYQDGHGFCPGQTLRHYWLSRRTSDLYLTDMKKVIKELLNGSIANNHGKIK